MLRKFTFLALLVSISLNAFSQYCGFDKIKRDAMAADPVFAKNVKQLNDDIQQYLQNHPKQKIINTGNGVVYEIPVVVHIIHAGGAVGTNYNPTDAAINSMINYLNQTYAATWPSYPGPTAGGTKIPIQFALAKRDTNCAATSGIVRVDGSSLAGYSANGMAHNSGSGASEVAVKGLSRWPRSEYYNIWVVNKIDGQDGFNSSGSFTAGFAWLPGANANIDGTVMLAYTVQSGDNTLPHEMAHALSVYHTFNGDDPTNSGPPYSCPPNANCVTDGDFVCDTDPHIRTLFTCPTGPNACNGGTPLTAVVHNMMDYSNCPDRFTQGQADRMIAALTTAATRRSLISSMGGTALGTSAATACIPAGISSPSGNAGVLGVKINDATMTYMWVSSSGYTGDGNKFYVDNSCKHMVELTAGNSYDFTVNTGGGAQKVKIYVDYNNDGTFQASEEIHNYTGTQSSHTFSYLVPTVLTVPSLISCAPLRMRVVADNSTSITACGQLTNGQAEDYTLMIRGGGASSGTVNVAITQGSNPSCPGSLITFKATPGAGLTNATYEWMVNGGTTGITADSFTSSTLANNDVVTVKMKFVGACGFDSVISTGIVIQRGTFPTAVSIAVQSGVNPGCANQTLLFKATPTNGGTTPVYVWKVNGNVVGTNSDTFSAILNNGAVVTADITSNSPCASPVTATSNNITISHVKLTANITATASTLLTCAGTPVTFTANLTDGGNNPQYSWYINNVLVPGATLPTFTTSTLVNKDVVYAVFTATDACVSNATDTSNKITMDVAPTDTPTVVVAITKGSNPGCLDSLIEFTATVTKHGTNPDWRWYLNGAQVTTGLIYSSNTLKSGDIVTFTSTATDTFCYTQRSISINNTMALFSTPQPPFISLIGNALVSNLSGPVQWFGPRGLIAGATGQTYYPDTIGTYYAVSNNNGCYSAPSNKLLISLLDIAEIDLKNVKLYPNPTSGLLTIEWTAPTDARVNIYNLAGQGLYYEDIKGKTVTTLDLSRFIDGVYYIVLHGKEGKIGTLPIVLKRQ
ncbi:MAG TPA: GEVED domain-containing protein [Flavipsychrobacter sp.]|nr:GEVED domain-containing protein [Flavipsychrobacter sp.]